MTLPAVLAADRPLAAVGCAGWDAAGGVLGATWGATPAPDVVVCAVDGGGKFGTPSGRPAVVAVLFDVVTGGGADCVVGAGGGGADCDDVPPVTSSDDPSGLSRSTENGWLTATGDPPPPVRSGTIARLSEPADKVLRAKVTD